MDKPTTNVAEIQLDGLNFQFKTVKLTKELRMKCLRKLPRSTKTSARRRPTTFDDVERSITMYLSGLRAVEIAPILEMDGTTVNRIINLVAGRISLDVPGSKMHKENRVRNLIGDEPLPPSEFFK
jgi:hypothetical protein